MSRDLMASDRKTLDFSDVISIVHEYDLCKQKRGFEESSLMDSTFTTLATLD